MIAIKGMEMPESCDECRLQDEEYYLCYTSKEAKANCTNLPKAEIPQDFERG